MVFIPVCQYTPAAKEYNECMKIIQIVTVPAGGADPLVLGLSDENGVYRWIPTESRWAFWGNNEKNSPFTAQAAQA
jgi:hypothetical protein